MLYYNNANLTEFLIFASKYCRGSFVIWHYFMLMKYEFILEGCPLLLVVGLRYPLEDVSDVEVGAYSVMAAFAVGHMGLVLLDSVPAK